MNRLSSILILLALVLVGRADEVFQKDILPILQKHCYDCHGADKQKGKLRLDTLDLNFDRGQSAERWHDALDKINLGEMPPEDEPPLTAAERRTLTGWLTQRLQAAAKARRSTGGQGVMRRLTRYEYANTLRDLLGVNLDFAKDLPPEPASADGFKNNGLALGMSAEQLEYYLTIARTALGKVIVEGDAPKVVQARVEKSSPIRRVKGVTGNTVVPGAQYLAKFDEFPREGAFRLRVHASAKVPKGAGLPRMRITIGVRADVQAPQETLVVTDVKPGKQVLEFTGRVEAFPLPGHNPKYPGLLARITNEYDDGSGFIKRKPKKPKKGEKAPPPDPDLARQPVIEITAVEFEGPLFDTWPPANHVALLGEPGEGNEESRAAVALKRFMTRAYRRPVTPKETGAMFDLYRVIRKRSDSFEAAMRETLALVLATPDFLYLVEPTAAQRRALNDHELAARLSYFLWSTMPDATLTQLADAGKLSEPKTLAAQVERLLADPRSDQFVEHFTDQWLNLSGINRVAVNPQFYPQFNDALKRDMRRETQLFFAEILRTNTSALRFIDADFAMLNRDLAKHYGLPETDWPAGVAFERVALKRDGRRGGLLTQGGILLANSDGEQSHPIRRAVWLLDRVLGSPPAPPPPDVPELDGNSPQLRNLSIRQQMEVHREKAACANCHRDIDPWGIAFEEYDAVGAWRDQWRANPKAKPQPVEALAELEDGTKLSGMAGLKAHLLQHETDRFSRALTEKMLAYALGRSLEFSDDDTVEALTQRFAKGDYQLRGLITSIVQSEEFLTK